MKLLSGCRKIEKFMVCLIKLANFKTAIDKMLHLWYYISVGR